MKQGERYPCKIIKHNFKARDGSSIKVEVVMGQSRAERVTDRYNRDRTKEEIEAGWSYFSERTTERPPTKPRHKAGSRGRLNVRRNPR
jgi:hypothetical protein